MQEQQRTSATAISSAHPRDPQSFTRGDVLAWKVLAYVAAAVTVTGSTAAIVLLVNLAA